MRAGRPRVPAHAARGPTGGREERRRWATGREQRACTRGTRRRRASGEGAGSTVRIARAAPRASSSAGHSPRNALSVSVSRAKCPVQRATRSSFRTGSGGQGRGARRMRTTRPRGAGGIRGPRARARSPSALPSTHPQCGHNCNPRSDASLGPLFSLSCPDCRALPATQQAQDRLVVQVAHSLAPFGEPGSVDGVAGRARHDGRPLA